MAQKKRVVIAVAHALLGEVLRKLLTSDSCTDVLYECRDGVEALCAVKRYQPDLALLDSSLPRVNGTEAVQEIRMLAHPTKTILLTVHNTERSMLRAVSSGADGCLLKDATQEDLLLCVKNIFLGARYFSPAISRLAKGHQEERTGLETFIARGQLNPLECRILKMVFEGANNEEIADLLGLRLERVERYRTGLMRKLDSRGASGNSACSIDSLSTLNLRECQILKLVSEGFKNREAAQLLGLSIRTVEKYRATLMKKLALRGPSMITSCAIDNGLMWSS